MQEISQYLDEYTKYKSEIKETITWSSESHCDYCCDYIKGIIFSVSYKKICERCLMILSHISASDFVVYPYKAFVPQRDDSPQRLAIVRLKYLQQLEAKMNHAKEKELDTTRLEYFIVLINALPPNHHILSYLSFKITEICSLYDFDNSLYYAIYSLAEESSSINLISNDTRRIILVGLDGNTVERESIIRFKNHIKEHGI